MAFSILGEIQRDIISHVWSVDPENMKIRPASKWEIDRTMKTSLRKSFLGGGGGRGHAHELTEELGLLVSLFPPEVGDAIFFWDWAIFSSVLPKTGFTLG